ncbi:MAG TPA: acyltransferase, partial [Microthrixaceae bacterium]|nr:acyltransferase [Microthrixaceae bacterium]
MTSIAQEAAPAPPRPRTRARTWGHRPALDGLRVVAVYLVVAYHGGLGIAEGGFLGVDLFFVLSGFLVTNVLLHEQATRHRIRLVRFYARRVRRLLPAAAVTIALTAVAFTYVAPPAERGEVLGGARSAFLYVANWHFLGQSNDYFAAEDAPSPFLHFWSLAIEEQF